MPPASPVTPNVKIARLKEKALPDLFHVMIVLLFTVSFLLPPIFFILEGSVYLLSSALRLAYGPGPGT